MISTAPLHTRDVGNRRQFRQFRQLLLFVAVKQGFSSGGVAVGTSETAATVSDKSTARGESGPCEAVVRRAVEASS